jgi:methylated-DNA-[protein]-cysteine S-methyltransferase
MTLYSTTVHTTPVGDVFLGFADDALLSLRVLHDDLDGARAEFARLVRTDAAPDADGAEVRRQLDEYFDGARRDFDLPLDWSLTRGFTRAALQAVRDIPYGETAGYGEVAIMAGSPRAARAVGTACATTPFSIVVPVHRVIRADGSLGEYGGHPEEKRFLLDLETGSGA